MNEAGSRGAKMTPDVSLQGVQGNVSEKSLNLGCKAL